MKNRALQLAAATPGALLATAPAVSLERVYVYASAVRDQDTRVARNQQMAQQAAQVYSELRTATACMRPEILAVGRPTIDRFIAEEPRLAQYRMYLDDILRAAPHALTPPEEKVLARAGNIIGKDAVKSGRAAQGREAYLRLLKAGSSKYPVDLLEDAGVDMTTAQPFDAAMRKMNRIMDEIERIYARQRG